MPSSTLNELREQKRIIDDIKSQATRAVAYKQSNRFLAGVPDLYVSVPGWPPFMMEIKVALWPRRGDLISVNLTQIQRTKMIALQNAGTRCGWAVIVRRPDGRLGMYTGIDIRTHTVHIHTPASTIRDNGGKWSLRYICAEMTPTSMRGT